MAAGRCGESENPVFAPPKRAIKITVRNLPSARTNPCPWRRMQVDLQKWRCAPRDSLAGNALSEYFRENRELMRISFATAFASPGEVPSGLRYHDKCRRNFEFVHSLMKRARAEGELDGRFDSRELAFGFYGQTNLYLMAHLTMPDCRLNRKTAERIVDLFLAGAAAKKNRN